MAGLSVITGAQAGQPAGRGSNCLRTYARVLGAGRLLPGAVLLARRSFFTSAGLRELTELARALGPKAENQKQLRNVARLIGRTARKTQLIHK